MDLGLLLFVFACLLAGLFGGGLGFGSALVLAPVAFWVLPLPQAVMAACLIPNVSNVLVLMERRAKQARWSEIWPLILWGLPGMFLGAWVLERISKPVGQIVLGAAVLSGLAFASRGSFASLSAWWARPVGFLCGLMQTSVGFNGPVSVTWLLGRIDDRLSLRDTMNRFFIFTGVAGALFLFLLLGRSASLPPWPLLLFGSLAVGLGYVAGARWFHSLDHERTFRRAAVLFLLLLALASIAAGLVAIA